MTSARSVELPLVDPEGGEAGITLRLRLLRKTDPNGTPPPLVDLRGQNHDASSEPVQLLEGTEYGFELFGLGDGRELSFEPKELFTADDLDGTRGRLRSGLRTGTVRVEIRDRELLLGSVALEVRSRKLEYKTEYRRMLSDIAEQFSEVVMERFAAATTTFALDDERDAPTLYQRFAFLRSIVTADALEASVRLVLRRPHLGWEVTKRRTAPGRGLRGGSHLAKQLSAGGRRVPWLTRPADSPITHLPSRVDVRRTESTFDTVPNRFVKFVLERWRYVLTSIDEALAKLKNRSSVVSRGRREVAELLAYFDSILAEPLFREVGRLSHFPAENQVLQKRAGYRDIARAYTQFELAARLTWDGGDDVYGAGQKDVATLYEYWVFLQLGRVIQELAGQPFDFSKLMVVRPDGLGIQLKRRHQVVLSGTVERHGRRLRLQYCFNRAFRHADGGLDSSWTRTMRPDCSLKIEPAKNEPAGFPPIWLHFDAKYKVDHIRDLFGGDEEDEDGEELTTRQAKRADLLKMHAYRDAIRRSAGAYVVYPGDKEEPLREFHELLPGLGAFPLRPEPGGAVYGANALAQFIDDVLDHVASQLTQHERARWWNKAIYEPESREKPRTPNVPFLRVPAADSRVLLGYVKNLEHEKWIREAHLYNVRADGRRGSMDVTSLGVEWLVLYGPSLTAPLVIRVAGPVLVRTKVQLTESGYPGPGGDAYLCLPWEPVPDAAGLLTLAEVEHAAAILGAGLPRGAPLPTTWHALLST